jgi:NitT/TauT family transport system permease protein
MAGDDDKMKRLNSAVPSIVVGAILVAIWWAAVTATQSAIFPTPGMVVQGTLELAKDGSLWEHIGASLMRVGAGFGLAVVFAIPLGLWMGRVRGAFVTLNPIFQILRPISPIAWIPIAILWFGVGNASPIYLIFIASVFPMIVQTTSGVHTIEKRYLRAGENFGVPRGKFFRRVVFPASLPDIIIGMRIGLGVAWLVVVAAEMIALRSGLGYMIMDARNAGNRYDLVVAGMIIIGLIGLGLDGLMRLLQKMKNVRWRYAH